MYSDKNMTLSTYMEEPFFHTLVWKNGSTEYRSLNYNQSINIILEYLKIENLKKTE